MNYGRRFVTLYRRQGSRPSPWKRNAEKQNGCLGRPYCLNDADSSMTLLRFQGTPNETSSAKTRLGADCGSNHELLIAKFRLKLKKVGETTRPFRYDLNQIPYSYTRFKGLYLINRVPEERWTEVHDIAQEAVIKTIPKKKKCK